MPKNNIIKKPGSLVDITITDILRKGDIKYFGTSHPGLPECLIC